MCKGAEGGISLRTHSMTGRSPTAKLFPSQFAPRTLEPSGKKSPRYLRASQAECVLSRRVIRMLVQKDGEVVGPGFAAQKSS